MPGQIFQGQMKPIQMSLRQFTSIEDGPRKLTLKFGQNWYIADMDKCHKD